MSACACFITTKNELQHNAGHQQQNSIIKINHIYMIYTSKDEKTTDFLTHGNKNDNNEDRQRHEMKHAHTHTNRIMLDS